LRVLSLAIAALVLGACATTPEVDPVQLRLDDLDARVGRIDRIVSNQSLMQMAQRVDTLQEEVRGLRGRLEELQNENVKLRKEQRDLYADLDQRLSEAAAAATAATVVPAASDEQTLYDQAFEQLKQRNYAAAVESFRSLAAALPNGQLADNTQYWLGEAYYVTQEYDHAAAAFQRVLTTWPNSRKAPDALLKLGYTQIEQKKLAAARVSLQQVVSKYPDSDAAKLAAERLTKLPKP
jgi:tol-pal system protein YbgF